MILDRDLLYEEPISRGCHAVADGLSQEPLIPDLLKVVIVGKRLPHPTVPHHHIRSPTHHPPCSPHKRSSALACTGKTSRALPQLPCVSAPVRHARSMFPVQTASLRPPLPHVNGSPVLHVLWADLAPSRSSAPLLVVGYGFPGEPGIERVSHVLDASRQACHALRTPTDRPAACPDASFVVASGS